MKGDTKLEGIHGIHNCNDTTIKSLPDDLKFLTTYVYSLTSKKPQIKKEDTTTRIQTLSKNLKKIRL